MVLDEGVRGQYHDKAEVGWVGSENCPVGL